MSDVEALGLQQPATGRAEFTEHHRDAQALQRVPVQALPYHTDLVHMIRVPSRVNAANLVCSGPLILEG